MDAAIYLTAAFTGAAIMIVEILGADVQVRESGERDRPGKSEINELIADNRRALEVLHWRPAVSLREGLRMTIAGTAR